MTLSVLAPIKVNLALHVGPPKADGYHPVDTLCVFPALGDIVSYDREAPEGLDFAGPFAGPLIKESLGSNLVWRAFELLDLDPEGRFFLTKLMPVASGVGAGTADGAAAMLLLNEALGLGLSAEALIEKSLGLGADGPVCMAAQIYGGGLWRARGIGEKLDPLGSIEPAAIVVANPGMAVPTGKVFRRFDASAPDQLEPVQLIRPFSLPRLVKANHNHLEPMAMAIEPAIASLRTLLAKQAGALVTQMSGSGATCFSLHASLTSAERATRVLRGHGVWAESALLLHG